MTARTRNKGGNGSNAAKMTTERARSSRDRIATGDVLRISAVVMSSNESISSAIRIGATTMAPVAGPGLIAIVMIGVVGKRIRGDSARPNSNVVNQTATTVGGESASDNYRTSVAKTIGA